MTFGWLRVEKRRNGESTVEESLKETVPAGHIRQGRLSPNTQVHISSTSPPSFPAHVILERDPNNVPTTYPLICKDSKSKAYLHCFTIPIIIDHHPPESPSRGMNPISRQSKSTSFPFHDLCKKSPETQVRIRCRTTTPYHHATPNPSTTKPLNKATPNKTSVSFSNPSYHCKHHSPSKSIHRSPTPTHHHPSTTTPSNETPKPTLQTPSPNQSHTIHPPSAAIIQPNPLTQTKPPTLITPSALLPQQTPSQIEWIFGARRERHIDDAVKGWWVLLSIHISNIFAGYPFQ